MPKAGGILVIDGQRDATAAQFLIMTIGDGDVPDQVGWEGEGSGRRQEASCRDHD